MQSNTAGVSSIDAYIAMFPQEIQTKLQAVREAIRAAAPDAEEKISYQMPAFALHGNLVYFGAMKQHIGFYPTASGIAAFQLELTMYASSKGAVRFPIDRPLPLDLIGNIVRFRVAENLAKAAAKSRKSKG